MTYKIIEKKYKIKNKKTNKNIRIFLMSDLHISNIFKYKKLDQLLLKIKENNPNYICIPGDIIDGTNVLDNRNNEDKIISFLKDISHISKVIISLGNHDISRLVKTKEHKWKKEINEKFLNEIRKIKDVYLLENNNYSDNKINFIGFNPSFKYYKETEEEKNLFIKELNSIILNVPNNKYNILLCHTPVHVLDDEVLKKVSLIKNIDLILSGHMHNGVVHPIMELFWKGNSGIITPTKKLYPKIARGIVKKHDKTLIISGGITKLSYSAPSIFHPFNDLYPMNIEVIDINKDK